MDDEKWITRHFALVIARTSGTLRSTSRLVSSGTCNVVQSNAKYSNTMYKGLERTKDVAQLDVMDGIRDSFHCLCAAYILTECG